jgi:hypothetical protein
VLLYKVENVDAMVVSFERRRYSDGIRVIEGDSARPK